MKISVVILNYNVRFFLELCLQSVQASLKGISSEIIVIDNNSSDDSCNMVKSIFPEVKLIENNENIGFSKGNNLANGLAKGEYLCVLNPDTVVAEDTFQKILKFSDTKTNLGIVGCRFMDGSGKFLPECKRNIPKLSSALGKLLGNGKSYYATAVDQNSIAEVPVLTGAFMLMRRELFTALNGFDEDFFMYGEDIDLCYRALKMNRNNYYYGASTLLHFKGESSPKNKIYYKRFYKAMQLFHSKHFESNFLMRWVVRTATKMVPYFLSSAPIPLANRKEIAFLNPHSSEATINLKNASIIKSLEMLKPDVSYDLVLDANVESFKAILNQISTTSLPLISFKIWPKNSHYCVGSDASIQRGEVILFDEFLS